mmetsp:Transcript_9345/g.14178  ORF Transcript_9345/g.14178 Transcript_9345/m.14178 type:complete len:88 (-) Transcript_9345:519-782(-)
MWRVCGNVFSEFCSKGRWKTKGNESGAKKVRKGKVGGYLEEATQDDIYFMETHAHFVDAFKVYESKISLSKQQQEELQISFLYPILS